MGSVGAPCEVVARLLLDERGPERSGGRLLEWAADCRASGVVVPRRPFLTPTILRDLRGQARSRRLICYVEVEGSTDLQHVESLDADGYLVGAWEDDALMAALHRARRPLLVLVSGAGKLALPDRLRTWRGSGLVTVIYDAQRDEPTPHVLRQLTQRWAGPVGYADAHPDLWPAVSSIVLGPRVVLKGLTLNRSLGGLRHQGGLSPHEFALLVERIRQQEALLRGESWSDGSAGPSIEPSGLEDTESLAAARPLRAGQVIGEGDLKPVAGLRGLTTTMIPRVRGARLLYDRQPEEPMTFGVIEPIAAGTSGPALDVSVVIRSKNEGRWIRRTLAAIRCQRRPPQEIIVVDNESSDETARIARSFGCTVLSVPDGRFSFGGALNAGIAAAESPWVVSLSAHCIPVHDRWLDALFVPGGAARSTAAIYGRQEPLPDTSNVDKRDLWTTFGEEPRVQQGRDYFFHNANAMIRRAVWTSIPFDERLSGVEDRDWAKKALADGYRILYAPLASVHHHHGIHQGRNESRARRVAQVIELIQQRVPADSLSGLPG